MNMSVCACVCLCVRKHISQTTCEIFVIIVHVAYHRGSVILRRGDEISRGSGNFGVLFPIDNAYYKA